MKILFRVDSGVEGFRVTPHDIHYYGRGGSYIALYYLTRALAARKHDVYIALDNTSDSSFDGSVWWIPLDSTQWTDTIPGKELDALVCIKPDEKDNQTHESFIRDTNCRFKKKYLWMHNGPKKIPYGIQMLQKGLVDKIVCVSEFHRRLHGQAGISDELLFLGRNGIHTAKVRGKGHNRNPEDRFKLVYSGHPAKAIDLEAIFMMAKQEIPELELHIYGSNDLWASNQHVKFMNLQAKDLHYHGSVGQENRRGKKGDREKKIRRPPFGIYEALLSCGIMLFPSTGLETSCITVLEALACGTVPIVRPIENQVNLITQSGGGKVATTKQDFVDVIKNLIDRPQSWKFHSHLGHMWIMDNQYDWSFIAKEWEDELGS